VQQIQLAAVPTQRLAVTLAGQPCTIEVRWNGDALYLSLWLRDEPVLTSKVCRDGQLLLTGVQYRGFAGDLLFVDTQGETDPVWFGLADRYALIYLTAAETP
jgi:hypothetical protein